MRAPVRTVRIAAALALALAFASGLQAQRREYVVSAGARLVGGGSNHYRFGPGTGNGAPPLESFYGAYPTISITSGSARSTLTAGYAFGIERTGAEPVSHATSHAAEISFSRSMRSGWTVTLDESFLLTDDAATFSAFRRGAPAERVPPAFDPLPVRHFTRTNRAGIQADYALSARSTLAFDGSHYLHRYGGAEPAGNIASDQQGFSGGIAYARRSGTRETWRIGYNGAYYGFANFDAAHSHSVYAGYTNQLAPDLAMQLTVGLSRVDSQGSGGGYTGYDTSVTLSKTIEESAFALYYIQTTGQPSGVGSTSDTRRAGASWDSRLGDFSVFLDASVFDSQTTLGPALDRRGGVGTAGIGVALTDTIMLEGGFQYQRSRGVAELDYDQKRVFLAINFRAPELWRFFR